ncbi:MAG: ATP F0F1 synthase subunit I [Salinarimonadaceae bacterium]|nr:MAG: ATP F0F1 synthase subunit I [Salinarimonadaceae bacterium]
MVDPKRPDNGDSGKSPNDEADLSTRLERLDSRLGEISEGRAGAQKDRARAASNTSGLGQAFRLSAEFISGVIAGGLLGWLIDRLLGTSPWGLLVCMLLGFGAGMLNMLRASGELKRDASSASSPGDATKPGRGPNDK